jgi:hypothetical protein
MNFLWKSMPVKNITTSNTRKNKLTSTLTVKRISPTERPIMSNNLNKNNKTRRNRPTIVINNKKIKREYPNYVKKHMLNRNYTPNIRSMFKPNNRGFAPSKNTRYSKFNITNN